MMKQPMVTSEDFKACLLETFKFVKQFLSEQGLRYVACGGTVLGAVRHRGFIPWDDDIDIYMPRADYNRLLEMDALLHTKGYEVISYRNKGYYMPFAKISSLSSTIWEFSRLPFLMGVYVDIFPLDEFDDTDEAITAIQYKSHYYFDKYINAVSYYPVSFLFHNVVHFDFHQIGLYVLNFFRKRHPDDYLNAFIDFENSYVGQKGDKTVCVTQWEGRIFQTSWFTDVIELPFEDTTVTVPRDYDAYLRKLYGDYMVLPPVEKRVSHPHFFVNLHQRLTIRDIRRMKE